MELEKMETKVCSKCKKELPITHFWKQRKTRDGLRCYCKECSLKTNKQWRKNNPEKIKELNRNSWRRLKEEKLKGDKIRIDKRHEFLDSLKTDCVKCGESRVWVIQFHHKNPKEKSFTIGEGANFHKSKESVIAEIKKTVCLCANCHKEYHYFYGNKSDTPVEDLEQYLNGGTNNESL